MRTVQMLDQLRASGVSVRYEPSAGLVLRGPRGRLTGETLDQLRAARPQLLVAVAASLDRELRVRAAVDAFRCVYERINALAPGHWHTLYDRIPRDPAASHSPAHAEREAEQAVQRFTEEAAWEPFAEALGALEAAYQGAVQWVEGASWDTSDRTNRGRP